MGWSIINFILVRYQYSIYLIWWRCFLQMLCTYICIIHVVNFFQNILYRSQITYFKILGHPNVTKRGNTSKRKEKHRETLEIYDVWWITWLFCYFISCIILSWVTLTVIRNNSKSKLHPNSWGRFLISKKKNIHKIMVGTLYVIRSFKKPFGFHRIW